MTEAVERLQKSLADRYHVERELERFFGRPVDVLTEPGLSPYSETRYSAALPSSSMPPPDGLFSGHMLGGHRPPD